MNQNSSSTYGTWVIRAAGAVASLIGGYWLAAWLGGWAGQWSAQGAATGAITVKTNMAVGQLLGGLALLLLTGTDPGRMRRMAGACLAAVVILIGALTLGEHLSGFDLGLDQLLAREAPGATGTLSPNRIGPPGSLSLVLLGAGLFALAWGRRAVVPYFGLAVCLINLVPAVGFLYGIEEFYNRPYLTTIAWPTVASLLSLGLGLVLSQRETGPMVLLLRPDEGGALLRKMLPVSILVPLVLGFLRVQAQSQVLVDKAMGTGLLVVTLILVFSILLWRSAARLSRSSAAEAEAYQAVRASEARLNHAQQIANVGSWEWDIETGEVLWSEQVFRQMGEQPGRFMPRYDAIRQRVHSADRAAFETAIERALAGLAPYDLDFRIVRPDGAERLLHAQGEVVFNNDGSPRRMMGVCLDMTERKRVEEALRQSQEQYRHLVEGSGSVILRADKDMRITYMNQFGLEFFGYAPEEIIGKPALGTIIPPRDADGRDIAAMAAELMRHPESYATNVHQNLRKDGRLVWMSWANKPIYDDQGNLVELFAIGNDITIIKQAEEALRNSERLYRAIGESIKYGVWVCEPDGRNIYASESFLKLVGLTQQQCSDFGWGDILHPDDAERTIAAWKECVRTGGMWDIEHRCKGVDGQWHAILARGVPVRNEQGEITCWAGINLDIGRRREAEERLREANEQLREADRRKDEFLAMLAHELRNPLAPVRNAVQILKMVGPSDPVLQRNREMIERQVAHMARLLDDLLDVSRITRGKIALQMERLDLRVVVAEAVEVAEHTVHGRPLSIQYENPAEPVWVNGDYTRLEQIVGNVVNNSIKYTDDGRIEVALECEPDRDGDGGWAVVRVRDTGLGIAAETLPHIFDLFVQADQSLDRRRGGLGIGLTMVQLLAQMHGGQVTAHSDGPTQGSVFTIRLPLGAGPEMMAADDDARDSAAVFAARDKPLRVLVVDDNEDAACSMADIVRLWGFEIDTAHDGPTAFSRAMVNPPDVILLDIGLPGMNGYEVARLLRCEPALESVKIIALTGYGQDEARQRSKECGFDGHLVKPVEINELRGLLARVEGRVR